MNNRETAEYLYPEILQLLDGKKAWVTVISIIEKAIDEAEVRGLERAAKIVCNNGVQHPGFEKKDQAEVVCALAKIIRAAKGNPHLGSSFDVYLKDSALRRGLELVKLLKEQLGHSSETALPAEIDDFEISAKEALGE